MNRKIGLFLRMLSAVCLLIVLGGAQTNTDYEPVTLNGEIEVADYGHDGEATSIVVNDREWGLVLISNSGVGSELLAHVGAVLEITGELTEIQDESGYTHSIRVTDYSILEPAEPTSDRE